MVFCGVGDVHKILTNTVYVSQWIFSKCRSKTGKAKPKSECIVVDVTVNY